MSTRERPRTSVKDRALRLLSVRSRSRAELRIRLVRAGYEPLEIEEAIADLEAVGLVDDERFAREYAEHQGKGIDRAVAEQAVGETNPEDEAERAFELARGRLERLRGLPPDIAHRRTVGFLLRRGYEPIIAGSAVRRAAADMEPR